MGQTKAGSAVGAKHHCSLGHGLSSFLRRSSVGGR
jgi:hypothetical protein